MLMGLEQMKQALEAASINLNKCRENFRQENARALRDICNDENLYSFFDEFSFDNELSIGEYSFYQANCLKKNFTWEDEFKWAITLQLLPVGHGINGDILVVDLVDFQAGILFHDFFWENPEEDQRKYLVKMNCSLGHFYLNSVQIPDYPIDAYEAAALMKSPFTGYTEI